MASYPIERIAGYLVRKVLQAALAVVPALAGTVLYLVPYTLVALIAWRVRHEPNQVATYKVFPGIASIRSWWLLLGIAAWRTLGAEAGIAMLLLSPYLALVAVRFHERLESFWREARAFLLLKGKRTLAVELKRRRLVADERIDRLAQLWLESQAYEPGSRGD